jgi:AraC family transcriptional regulator
MVKNMVCNCCVRIIRQELEKLPIKIVHLGLGEIKLSFDQDKINVKAIEKVLEKEGFPVVVDKEKILVEQIKTAVVELIHFASNKSSIIRNSDYLVEKLDTSYQVLTTVFSKHEGITLEKFIILHKIEKVKELLDYDELTLSEIAYDMGYSSVQYLSTVFKSITGISVTEYKKTPGSGRKAIDRINEQ